LTKVVDRFLRYVKYNTASNEESITVPSTSGQLAFAETLAKELVDIGMQEVSVDKNGYVMAKLPSNIEKKVPVIGFIAHMDTSPDMNGENVKPKFVQEYKGGDIVLNKEKKIVLSSKEFPELNEYIGKTLIVTDGTTLLGADDKAGIAEIMAALQCILENPDIKHGTIMVAFTPDEEVGRGADHFDVRKFNADFAYTVDGGKIGELEYENFNAAGLKVVISGRNVHPGYAKDKMINSMLIAHEFMAFLPNSETPSKTDGYEGFYHLTQINGCVEETQLHYIIRDFDTCNYEKRKEFIKDIADKLNNKYGKDTVKIELKDQYRNMREVIEPIRHVVDLAYKAMEAVQVNPVVVPIRGGTDGARLSFMGLPTPNIFTGGENFHGRYEYIPTYAMEKAVDVIIKIVEFNV